MRFDKGILLEKQYYIYIYCYMISDIHVEILSYHNVLVFV